MAQPLAARICVPFALIAALATLHPRISHAQVSWTGGGADGLWTNASNWSATPPATGGTLVFSGTTRTSGTNDAAVTSAAFLNFTNNGTAGQTSSFTLSGSALSLTGATGIETTAVMNGNQLLDTIALDIALASTTGTTTISAGASHNVRLTGVVSGTGSLTKSGVGTLFLAGANTYAGSTHVSAGTLNIWNGENLGAASNPVVLDGGAFELGSTYVTNPVTIGSAGGAIRTARNFTSSLANAGLTGTGTLAIGGGGTVRMLEANSAFTGPVVIGMQGQGSLALRDAGSLTGVSTFAIAPGGTLTLDDTGSANVVSRISASSTVALQGGNLTFLARNSAGNTSATVGTVDLSSVGGAAGAATITATRNVQDSNLTIGNLIRGRGASPVIIVGSTFSGVSSGNISRVFLTQVNGAAVTDSSWLGGWAVVNNGNSTLDFAAYVTPSGGGGGVVVPGSVGAPSYTTLTAASAPGSGGWDATNVGNFNTTGTMTLGAAGAGQNFSLLALRTGTGAATATIGFAGTTGTPDTLYLGNGGLIHANAQPRHIGVSGGTAYTRGRVTAGEVGLSGTAPVELFLYSAGNSQTNSLTVNSQIIDNPGGDGHPLTVFARGNHITLTSSNSYSGGTQVVGSRLTASVAGALGAGKAFANGPGSWLILSSATASTFAGSYADPTYTAVNGGQISVPNAARASNEFVNIDGDSAFVLGGATGAASWDIGVNVNLAPGAIVAGAPATANSLKYNGVAITTVTTPTWYLGLTANTSMTGTVGAATPWLGFAAPNAITTANITASTITLNSDIEMRGVSLGNGASGTEVISFVTSRPTTIAITGSTMLGTPNVSYGSATNPVTFFVTPGGALSLGNAANSLGVSGSVASVVVQNGGSFSFGSAAGVNGAVTLQAGGRFVANNSSGLTSTGLLAFNNGSILDIVTQANGFSGSQATAATIDPGTIVRLGIANITNGATGPVDAILGGKAGVTGVSYELTGGGVANPASAATIMTLNASAGGVGGFLTNDSSARTLAATANGVIAIGSNGGGMAATTNTTLTVTENFSLGANVLTIGSAGSIDGNLKLGIVQLNSTANTNTALAGSRIDVISGGTLQLGVADQIPNATVLNLAGAFDMNKLSDAVGGLAGSGTVANGSNAASTLTIQGSGSASIFSGVIQNVTGGGSSTVALTVSGSADQTLSGANTYTGATTVNDGTLRLANQNAIQNSTLTLSGTGAVSFASSVSGKAFSIGGLAAANAAASIALENSAAEAIALTVGGNNASTTYSGTLAGAGRLVKVGTGTLTLGGANTFSGGTEIDAGTISLGSAGALGTSGAISFQGGTLQFSGSNTTDYSNRFDTAPNQAYRLDTNGQAVNVAGNLTSVGGSLAKLGSGTLTLSGNNSYAGATTLAGGVLQAGSVNAFAGAGPLSFTGGTLQVGTGGNGINITGRVKDSTSAISINANGQTLTLSGAIDSTNTVGLTGSSSVAGGAIAISGNNTYSGTTTFSSANVTVQIGSSNAFGTSLVRFNNNRSGAGAIALTDIVLSNTVSIGTTFDFAGSNSITLSGVTYFGNVTNSTNVGNAISPSAGKLLALSGPVYLQQAGGSASNATATLAGSGNTLISGVIRDSDTGLGTSSLSITNTGTTTLLNANEYTGGTTLGGAGTVVLANDIAFGGGPVTASSAVTIRATTDLAGIANAFTLTNNPTFAGENSMVISGSVTNSAGNRVITNNLDAGKSLTFAGTTYLRENATSVGRVFSVSGSGRTVFSGAIVNGGTAGSGGFTHSGSGVVVLSASNSYTGSTTVNGGGVLRLDSADALPGGIGTSGGLSFLDVDTGVVGLAAGDFSRNLGSGASDVRLKGTASGFAAYGGTRIVNMGGVSGTLTMGAGNFSATAVALSAADADGTLDWQNPLNLNGGVREFRVANGAANIDAKLSGVLSGNSSAGLTKTGAGTLQLTALNTYSGTTTINGGRLLVDGSGDLSNTARIVINGPDAELKWNSSAPLSKPIDLTQGILSGTGSIATALTLNGLDDVLAPGNSPGVMSFGASQTWNSFTYAWETNNFLGTSAGIDFDTIAITGGLDLTGGANAYLLDITSLTASNLAGNVGNFSNENRSWTILTTTGGITGFNAANWTLSTANFTSSPAATGSWSLNKVSNDVVLSYVVVVPEPDTIVFAGIGIAMAGWSLWKRRRITRSLRT